MAFTSKTIAILTIGLLLASQFSKTQAFKPLVETGVSELSPDGKHVGVNVPPFFTMQLDTRGPNKGLRMSQSILTGFVQIAMDREAGEGGKFHGPVKVSVGGITMYDNNEPSLKS